MKSPSQKTVILFVALAVLGGRHFCANTVTAQETPGDNDIRQRPPIGSSRHRRATQAAAPSTTVEHSLALISAGDSTGTGFLLEDEGNTYLVTGEQVVLSGFPFAVKMLNANMLEPTAMEYATDRQLIRFRITGHDDAPGLRFATEQPAIDAPVRIFGDSGSGTITRETGRITGIGFDRIDTRARFVRSHNGAPIVNAQDLVVAVAAHIESYSDPAHWFRTGTRHRGFQQYGILLSGTTWQPVEMDAYLARVSVLRDAAVYCEDLRRVYTAGFFDETVEHVDYDYRNHERRYIRRHDLCRQIAQSVEVRNAFVARFRRIREAQIAAQRAQRDGMRSMAAEHEANWQLQMAERERQDVHNMFIKLILNGERLLDHDQWLTVALANEAVSLLSYLRHLRQLHTQ